MHIRKEDEDITVIDFDAEDDMKEPKADGERMTENSRICNKARGSFLSADFKY